MDGMRVPRWNMFVSVSAALAAPPDLPPPTVVGRRLEVACSWSVPRPRTERRVLRVARKETA
jgi:hypothetical protein